MRSLALATIALTLTCAGCSKEKPQQTQAEIAVTNTYIKSAVLDLCAGEEVLCIAAPGMCPGHFDMKPGQITQLRSSKILLLFDFQRNIREQLGRIEAEGLNCCEIRGRSGLCVPATYLATCAEVAQQLKKHYPDRAEDIESEYHRLEKNLVQFGTRMLDATKSLKGIPVICSQHQKDFAEWLGLDVVAQFQGSDAATPPAINNCIKLAETAGARFVIANKQEGTKLAESMAKRLVCEVVVFSNFPEVNGTDDNFTRLVETNVTRLLEITKDQ